MNKLFEADKGENVSIPPVVTETPPAVVHTTVETAKDAAEIPHAAINETLQGLTTATHALTEAANKLIEASKPVVTEPVEGASQLTQDIAPDIELPPPENRYIRRNGRKVKR